MYVTMTHRIPISLLLSILLYKQILITQILCTRLFAILPLLLLLQVRLLQVRLLQVRLLQVRLLQVSFTVTLAQISTPPHVVKHTINTSIHIHRHIGVPLHQSPQILTLLTV